MRASNNKGEMSATFSKTSQSDNIICMRNFNAKKGSANKSFEHIIGKQGLGAISTNSEMLKNLCSSYDLAIGGKLKNSETPSIQLFKHLTHSKPNMWSI